MSEQVMPFKYWGIITNSKKLDLEERDQMLKRKWISDYCKIIVCTNNSMYKIQYIEN